jgi:hypothetical protein
MESFIFWGIRPYKGKGKVFLVQPVEALRVFERLRLPHFQTFGS